MKYNHKSAGILPGAIAASMSSFVDDRCLDHPYVKFRIDLHPVPGSDLGANNIKASRAKAEENPLIPYEDF